MKPETIKDLRDRIKQIKHSLPPSAKGGGVSVPLSQLDNLLDVAEMRSDAMEKCEDERDRLRDALEPFVTGAEELCARGYDAYVPVTHEQLQEAKQALEVK